jgi:hypothetical protein
MSLFPYDVGGSTELALLAASKVSSRPAAVVRSALVWLTLLVPASAAIWLVWVPAGRWQPVWHEPDSVSLLDVDASIDAWFDHQFQVVDFYLWRGLLSLMVGLLVFMAVRTRASRTIKRLSR